MTWEWLFPYLPWIGGLLSLGCMLAGFRNYRRKRLTEELPTSRALGVFMGLVEMKGAAECERPLCSRLVDATCVHYEWSIEEEWERTETVTETDSQGRTTQKTETRSGWTDVDKGSDSVPFYVKDATGAILVQPQGAEMDPLVVLNRTCSRDDGLYYGKGPAAAIADSTHRRRFVEKAIRLHGPVYIVGKARERKDAVAAEIAADESAPLFLISGHSEQEVQSSYFWSALSWTALGLVLLVAGLVIADVLQQRDLVARRPFYFACAGAYFAAWILGWVWNVFNDLIGLRNRVREGWSLIDIQLKRRHDLIPNLVRIVSALRDHERTVQEHLAALRAQAAVVPTGRPGPGHMALKFALAAVQEKYPVLKVMGAFQNLQKDLVETEERIALARDYYNSIATHFNTRIEQIPDRFVCLLTVMRRFELLSAQDFERAALKVDFAK
jgi:hypothetical protein